MTRIEEERRLELEIEKLKLEIEIQKRDKNNNIFEMLFAKMDKNNNIFEMLFAKMDNIEKQNREILDKLGTPKTVTGFQEPLVTLGPRVQQINPETMELVKVYESATQLMNENHNIKRPTLSNAVNQNTIYCGFRWFFVERDQDASKLENLQPTKATRVQNQGYIAKLTADQTEILNVYLDRKTAATMNGYDSSSALDTPVKNGTVTKGHVYKLFDECENRGKFIEKHGKEPLLYKNGFGMFDASGKMIREYGCRYDCIRLEKISDKSIMKSIEKNVPYKDTFFRYLGEKLSFI